jgi:hypothetical protein
MRDEAPHHRERLLSSHAAALASAVAAVWPQAKVLGSGPAALPFASFCCELELDLALVSGDLLRLDRAMRKDPRAGNFRLVQVSREEGAERPAPSRQRVHGIAAPSAEELRREAARIDRVAERDHLRLGRELGYFEPEPGAPGCFRWLPRGELLRNFIAERLRGFYLAAGYEEVRSGAPAPGPRRFEERRETAITEAPAARQRRSGARGLYAALATRSFAASARVPAAHLEAERTRTIDLLRGLQAHLGLELEARSEGEGQGGAREVLFLAPNLFGVHEPSGAWLRIEGGGAGEIVLRHSAGSIEALMARSIERHAGLLPFVLAPVVVRVVTASPGARELGAAAHRRLLEAGLRSELDERGEKLAYKLRQAALEKVPFLLVAREPAGGEERLGLRRLQSLEEEVDVDLESFIAAAIHAAQ